MCSKESLGPKDSSYSSAFHVHLIPEAPDPVLKSVSELSLLHVHFHNLSAIAANLHNAPAKTPQAI